MQRIGILILLGLIVTGCGAGSAAIPNTAKPEVVTVTPGPVSMTEFVASDQALVGKTGRPQVIEFFAFW